MQIIQNNDGNYAQVFDSNGDLIMEIKIRNNKLLITYAS